MVSCILCGFHLSLKMSIIKLVISILICRQFTILQNFTCEALWVRKSREVVIAFMELRFWICVDMCMLWKDNESWILVNLWCQKNGISRCLASEEEEPKWAPLPIPTVAYLAQNIFPDVLLFLSLRIWGSPLCSVFKICKLELWHQFRSVWGKIKLIF